VWDLSSDDFAIANYRHFGRALSVCWSLERRTMLASGGTDQNTIQWDFTKQQFKVPPASLCLNGDWHSTHR
jgi:hypothetical protein